MKKIFLALFGFGILLVGFSAYAFTPYITVTSPNDTHIALDPGMSIEIRWDTNVSIGALKPVSDSSDVPFTIKGKNINQNQNQKINEPVNNNIEKTIKVTEKKI